MLHKTSILPLIDTCANKRSKGFSKKYVSYKNQKKEDKCGIHCLVTLNLV